MATIKPWRNGRRFRGRRRSKPPDQPHKSTRSEHRSSPTDSVSPREQPSTTHNRHLHHRPSKSYRKGNHFVAHCPTPMVHNRSPVPLRGGHRRPFLPHHAINQSCCSGRHGSNKKRGSSLLHPPANGQPCIQPDLDPQQYHLENHSHPKSQTTPI